MRVEQITAEGMKIDRMFFEKFEDVIRANDTVAAAVEAGQWDRVIDYVNRDVFDKPEEFYTLDKLRKAAAVDRRLTLREILEKIFGLIPRFKSKDELLEEEFSKFVADRVPEQPAAIPAIKTYFKAYVTSNRVCDIIDSRQFTDLATNPYFTTHDFRAVPQQYRTLVPEYIKDYVALNQHRRASRNTGLSDTLTYVLIPWRQEMASTVNFTGAVDRDLLKRAKIIAAKTDTSVNALFNAELRHLVETFEAAEATGNQNYRRLLDFSLGRLAGDEAMRTLGIDSEEDLFLLMAQAHLPMPRLPEADTRDMVDQLKSLAN